MAEITVLMPTYNRPEHLSAALETLAGQFEREVPFSVVVVDDGSVPAVELDPGAFPFRLIFLRLEKNCGRSAARNAGLALVDSPLVVFLDDDMRVLPGFIRAYQEAIDPAGRAVGLGSVCFHPDIPRDALTRYLETRGIAKLKADEPIPFRYFLTYNSAVPTFLLREAGGFSERVRAWGGEDIELAWRLQKHGARFVRVPQARAYHAHRRRLEDVLSLSESFARECMPVLFDEDPVFTTQLRADLLGPVRYAKRNRWKRSAIRFVTTPCVSRRVEALVKRHLGARWPMWVFDYLIASAWRRGLDQAHARGEEQE